MGLSLFLTNDPVPVSGNVPSNLIKQQKPRTTKNKHFNWYLRFLKLSQILKKTNLQKFHNEITVWVELKH